MNIYTFNRIFFNYQKYLQKLNLFQINVHSKDILSLNLCCLQANVLAATQKDSNLIHYQRYLYRHRLLHRQYPQI